MRISSYSTIIYTSIHFIFLYFYFYFLYIYICLLCARNFINLFSVFHSARSKKFHRWNWQTIAGKN